MRDFFTTLFAFDLVVLVERDAVFAGDIVPRLRLWAAGASGVAVGSDEPARSEPSDETTEEEVGTVGSPGPSAGGGG